LPRDAPGEGGTRGSGMVVAAGKKRRPLATGKVPQLPAGTTASAGHSGSSSGRRPASTRKGPSPGRKGRHQLPGKRPAIQRERAIPFSIDRKGGGETRLRSGQEKKKKITEASP